MFYSSFFNYICHQNASEAHDDDRDIHNMIFAEWLNCTGAVTKGTNCTASS